MLTNRSYRRVGVFYVEEQHALIEGEWIRLPNQQTIDEKINEYFATNGLHPVVVSSPTIQQLPANEPDRRWMRIGVSVIYIPNEVISDGQVPQNQEGAKPSQAEEILRLLQQTVVQREGG